MWRKRLFVSEICICRIPTLKKVCTPQASIQPYPTLPNWTHPNPSQPKLTTILTFISVIDDPTLRIADKRHDKVTLPVPWISSLKQRYTLRYFSNNGTALDVSKSSNCTYWHRITWHWRYLLVEMFIKILRFNTER